MNDKWLRIIGIPIVALLATIIYKVEEYGDSNISLAIGYGIALIHTIVIWHGNRYIWLKFKQNYPGFKNTTPRIIRQVMVSFVYTVLANAVVVFYTSPNLEIHTSTILPNAPWYVNCSWFSLVMVAFFLAVYESRYFFNEWKMPSSTM